MVDAWLNQWTRLGDPAFGDDFTLPAGTPIACRATSANRLELAAVGKDAAVYNTFYDNSAWHGHWTRLGDTRFGDGFTLPLNTPITAISRKPGHLDLFAVGKDSAVYWTFSDNGNWNGQWTRLADTRFGDGFTLPLNTPITAVSRFASHIDLIAVGKDSVVYTTFYDDNGGWHGQWNRIGDTRFSDGFTLPLNTPITGVSRFASHLDVVAVGKDTGVYATYYDDNGQWHGWNRIGNGSFTLPLNTPVAAAVRVPAHLDLFAVGKDTGVYSTFYDDNGGYSPTWFRLGDTRFGDGFTLPPDAPIAAATRNSERIDLVAVGKDASVYSTYFGQFPNRPTMAGDTATFNPGSITSDLPLDGWISVVMKENGDLTVTGHAHDSGADGISYVMSAVILTPDGIAFTFQHSGSVEGTTDNLLKPKRDDDWTPQTGNNPSVTKEWAGIPSATIAVSLRGTDQLVAGLEAELQSLLKEVLKEVAEEAATAVIALL